MTHLGLTSERVHLSELPKHLQLMKETSHEKNADTFHVATVNCLSYMQWMNNCLEEKTEPNAPSDS